MVHLTSLLVFVRLPPPLIPPPPSSELRVRVLLLEMQPVTRPDDPKIALTSVVGIHLSAVWAWGHLQHLRAITHGVGTKDMLRPLSSLMERKQ